MGAPRGAELLADAADMYYVQGLTQQEVAAALDTTRSNVSRMLQAAREQGIVRFEIVRPLKRDRDLEAQIEERFGLRDAIVLDGSGAAAIARLGELGAAWLTERLEDGLRLTLSWGRTLQAMVEAMPTGREVAVEVGQLGGDLQLDPRMTGHELVRELAARCGGRYSYLHAPAILDSPATVQELRSLRGIQAELARAREADIALVGIGGYGHGFAAQLLESAHLSEDERREFDRLSPAGDIMARFYDEQGNQLDTPLRDRVLALELDELRQIPTVVAIAGGHEKGRGIWGALRAGWIDVLITDRAAVDATLGYERGEQPSEGPAGSVRSDRTQYPRF
jgi:DNA-binding transcriptional regulator LsrR (DeoR family)